MDEAQELRREDEITVRGVSSMSWKRNVRALRFWRCKEPLKPRKKEDGAFLALMDRAFAVCRSR